MARPPTVSPPLQGSHQVSTLCFPRLMAMAARCFPEAKDRTSIQETRVQKSRPNCIKLNTTRISWPQATVLSLRNRAHHTGSPESLIVMVNNKVTVKMYIFCIISKCNQYKIIDILHILKSKTSLRCGQYGFYIYSVPQLQLALPMLRGGMCN